MPWSNLTMEQERLNFINDTIDPNGKETFGEICAKYGITRKTGYKWVSRYRLNGCAGLNDLSRASHTHPNALPADIEDCVIQIRKMYPLWGPKKIRAKIFQESQVLIIPSESSIGNILKEHNLSKPRHFRRHVAQTAPLSACQAPNDVWMYDFKGYFKTGDGKICEPLTITDGFSRYLIKCRHMPRKRTSDVWEVLEEAFYQYGLPTKIRSDNGPPFASTGVGRLSPLAIKLIKAGVIPEWIEPGCPEQNGRHERFHSTLKQETANPPATSLALQKLKMVQFERYYNNERPHEALGQIVPSKVYKASMRIWDGQFSTPEYGSEFETRRVSKCGCMAWMGRDYFLSESLYQEIVGLKEIGVGLMGIFYGPILLGKIDFQKGYKRV